MKASEKAAGDSVIGRGNARRSVQGNKAAGAPAGHYLFPLPTGAASAYHSLWREVLVNAAEEEALEPQMAKAFTVFGDSSCQHSVMKGDANCSDDDDRCGANDESCQISYSEVEAGVHGSRARNDGYARH